MNIWSVFILSVVEGITEFLPISSTAHLQITSQLLGLSLVGSVSSFIIFIQLGAIVSVIVIYFDQLKSNLFLWLKIITAFLPTAIIGFSLYSVIKNLFLLNLSITAYALILGGFFLIGFEWWYKKSNKQKVVSLDKISYKQAFIIGCVQALAIIPGVSRSGATIVGGMSLGLSRQAIVEFSFLLAIPTMFSATVYDLWKNSQDLNLNNVGWLVLGGSLSFVFAYVSVKWLVKFISTHDFTYFGFYRIIIGLFILGFLV